MRKRLLKYLVLAMLVLIVPYMVIIVLTMVTGDRGYGMTHALLPSILLPHFIFGLYFIQKRILVRIAFSILLSVLALILVVVSVQYHFFVVTAVDMYGFFYLAINNFLGGLIAWEAFNFLDRFISARRVRTN
jgi:hypothetical protein